MDSNILNFNPDYSSAPKTVFRAIIYLTSNCSKKIKFYNEH